MTPGRVAVQIGAGAVRVAVAGDGGPVVAELPGAALRGPADLPALVAGVVGPVPVEVLLVHPAGWPGELVAAWTRGPVYPVPAPVAAAGGGPRIVLDVGGSGAEVALVDRGRVVAHRWCGVGGDRLDDVVAGLTGTDPARARSVRESLSLLPVAGGIDAEQLRVAVAPLLDEVVALLRAVRTVGEAPVLLVGGVARSPLLAELVDGATIGDAVVASRPETAAVVGALRLPVHAPVVPVEPEALAPLLPPPPPSRRRPVRRVVAALVAAGTTAALLGAGSLLRPDVATSAPAGVLIQYGYRFDVPAGWEHSGGLPERRRSLLTPTAAPEGSDLIAVERTPLGYDAAAEPDRARTELRSTYDNAVATGSPLSDYGTARVGGRAVTTYRQRDAGVVVEWFVVLDGSAQLSVGCRHTPAAEQAVRGGGGVGTPGVRRRRSQVLTVGPKRHGGGGPAVTVIGTGSRRDETDEG